MSGDDNLERNNNDDLEVCSIDDLLNEIDELESREPWKFERNSKHESSLVDSDGYVDVSTVDSSNADVSEEMVDNITVNSKKIRKNASMNKGKSLRAVFDFFKVVIIAVVIAVVLNKFVIANAIIPSGSMESTIMTGDRIIGLRVSYLFSNPERGDIVIFKNPDDESKLYIKRIIGLPGDKVEIKDGLVYINDSAEPLSESYISVTPKGNFGPYQVPDESYFMLGDNRNVSKDSRYWDNTFVHEDKIIAKAIFRYYPSLGGVK